MDVNSERQQEQDQDQDPAPTKHSDAQRVAGGEGGGEGRPERNDDAPGANRPEGTPVG